MLPNIGVGLLDTLLRFEALRGIQVIASVIDQLWTVTLVDS